MLASTVHLVRESATSLDRTALEADLGNLVAWNLGQLGPAGVPWCSGAKPRSEDLLRALLVLRALAARTLTGAIALGDRAGGLLWELGEFVRWRIR